MFAPKGYLAYLRNLSFAFTHPLFNTLYYTTNLYFGSPFYFCKKNFGEFNKIPEDLRASTANLQDHAIRKQAIEPSKVTAGFSGGGGSPGNIGGSGNVLNSGRVEKT